MDNRQAIISKIAQMSALKENSSAFQGEIENAAAMIQRLMEKYSISWAEIHQSESNRQAVEYDRQFKDKPSDYAHGFVKKWHWDLADLICKMTHTRKFLRNGTTMFFFGVEENAEIASSLYAKWVVIIDTAAKDSLKHYRAWLVKEFYTGQKNFYTQLPPQYQTKTYRESWIVGCIHGIHLNVEQQATQSSALVLYDEEIAKKFKEHHKKIKTVKTSDMKTGSLYGYSHGRDFGSKINLNSKELGK